MRCYARAEQLRVAPKRITFSAPEVPVTHAPNKFVRPSSSKVSPMDRVGQRPPIMAPFHSIPIRMPSGGKHGPTGAEAPKTGFTNKGKIIVHQYE